MDTLGGRLFILGLKMLLMQQVPRDEGATKVWVLREFAHHGR